MVEAHKTSGLPETQETASRLHFLGGATRIRTGESRFCRPLPYHLAMAPKAPSAAVGICTVSRRWRLFWSGRRDSNPRPSPWQGDALPLSHFRETETLVSTPLESVVRELGAWLALHCILCQALTRFQWWLGTESNRRHEDFQSSALPTELPSHATTDRSPCGSLSADGPHRWVRIGGTDGTRTHNPCAASAVLSL
jgi:hypothetical protein